MGEGLRTVCRTTNLGKSLQRTETTNASNKVTSNVKWSSEAIEYTTNNSRTTTMVDMNPRTIMKVENKVMIFQKLVYIYGRQKQ